jgi:hypothetical protein
MIWVGFRFHFVKKRGSLMRIIYSLVFLLIFLVGVYLGIMSYRRSKAIFRGTERRFIAAIVDSARFGLSLSLVIFGGVYLLASVTNNSYPLEIISLLKSFAFFLIPGFLVFLGSFWQYFIFGLYRDRLLKFILRRRNDNNYDNPMTPKDEHSAGYKKKE